MTTKIQRLGIIAAVIGGTLLSYVVVAILLVGTINRFGMGPIYAAMNPHNAYVLWRARREIRWHGIRIRVEPQFVLDENRDRVHVDHVDSMSIVSLARAMTFFAADPKRTQNFQRSQSRCTVSAEDECVVFHSTLRSGVLTCDQHRGRRARPTFGQFELWSCEDANGLQAVFFGTPEECREKSDIALKAFATSTAHAR